MKAGSHARKNSTRTSSASLDLWPGRNHPCAVGGDMSDLEKKMDRKTFLSKSATLVAGGAALASTALSSSRIVGANERISLAHIGIGNRGTELDGIAAKLRTSQDRKSVV